ncbi:MAG TPA: carbonic anhydrase [Bryobacteraceae bacterium]|nr:carbonic anhydrase [Bryobacteraceae bacterium]
MQKLFHFDCPQEVYHADACVISCIDARFDLAVRKFLKRRGILTFDHVKIPGSAKSLAAPDCEADRDFVLRMVRTSLRLHSADRVLLFAHNECGAYPGIAPDAIAADALKAAEFLRAAEPSVPVDCFFADFDGIYAIP